MRRPHWAQPQLPLHHHPIPHFVPHATPTRSSISHTHDIRAGVAVAGLLRGSANRHPIPGGSYRGSLLICSLGLDPWMGGTHGAAPWGERAAAAQTPCGLSQTHFPLILSWNNPAMGGKDFAPLTKELPHLTASAASPHRSGRLTALHLLLDHLLQLPGLPVRRLHLQQLPHVLQRVHVLLRAPNGTRCYAERYAVLRARYAVLRARYLWL